jgi:hypothetical protein
MLEMIARRVWGCGLDELYVWHGGLYRATVSLISDDARMSANR